jgi:DNA-binding CsgD family transcriptional regulator
MINKAQVKEMKTGGLTMKEIASELNCSEGRVWQILKDFGMTRGVQAMSVEGRLKDRLKVDRSTGCWEFQGNRYADGYGQIKVDGRNVRAHRLSYSLLNGEIPAGMIVCHSCDNPPCCNPDHLFIGNHQDNANDKVSKRRQAKGSSLPQSKVDSDMNLKIKELYNQGLSQRAIGKKIGVSKTTVGRHLQS